MKRVLVAILVSVIFASSVAVTALGRTYFITTFRAAEKLLENQRLRPNDTIVYMLPGMSKAVRHKGWQLGVGTAAWLVPLATSIVSPPAGIVLGVLLGPVGLASEQLTNGRATTTNVFEVSASIDIPI